jgi:signal transduction histidine kinase
MLHPALLDQSGLIATLRWYLETIANRTGMRVETQLPEESFRAEPEIEISLFRLTQEWLNGMLLRGDPSAIVSLAVEAGKIELRVESRGSPWEKTEWSDLHSGRGTLGVFVSAMRQRLRQSGGSIAFKQEDSSMVLSAVVSTRPRR